MSAGVSPSLPINVWGSVVPVHMLGESHCMAFDGLLFQPQGHPDLLLCHACYLPTVPASQFSLDGHVNGALAAALVSAGVLDPGMQAAYLSTNASVAYIAGRALMAPALVVFGGDTELLSRMYVQLGDVYDFALPDDPGFGVDRNKQPVPYQQVHAQITQYLAPMFKALDQLRQHHLGRIVVHGLPPRNADQAAVSLNAPGPLPDVAVRSKLALLVNRELAAACARLGFAYVDIWPETTVHGVLRPEFALDGIHLNRKAAKISLEKIAAALVDYTRANANAARYARAAELAQAPPADAQAHQAQWDAQALVAMQTDPGIAATLAQWMAFAPDAGNTHARPDWVGSARQAQTGLARADPSAAVLQQMEALLTQAPVSAALHAGAGHALTAYSLRPQRSAQAVAYAPHSAHTPVPPGVRCAVLHLAGPAQYLFEPIDGATQQASVVDAQVGLLVVFDPRRLRYRVQSTGTEFAWADIALGPRLQGQPFRMLWAGAGEWPADPFHFTLHGMQAHPPLTQSVFSARAIAGVLSNTD